MATRRYSYVSRPWQFKLSFWLVVIIGIAIAVAAILSYVFGDGWASHLEHIITSLCFAVAMFIPVSMSWQVAKYKGTAWKVLWVIFVILIVVGLVFRILGLIRSL